MLVPVATINLTVGKAASRVNVMALLNQAVSLVTLEREEAMVPRMPVVKPNAIVKKAASREDVTR
jgi:hypothetical protein